jgi:hypothetical protein
MNNVPFQHKLSPELPIITIGINCRGEIILPKKGIPLRSSLSPFFGALDLSRLDRIFGNCRGVFYRRFMDDIIVLIDSRTKCGAIAD